MLVAVYVSGRERGAERAAGKVAWVEPLGAVVSWLKSVTQRSLAGVVGSQVGVEPRQAVLDCRRMVHVHREDCWLPRQLATSTQSKRTCGRVRR